MYIYTTDFLLTIKKISYKYALDSLPLHYIDFFVRVLTSFSNKYKESRVGFQVLATILPANIVMYCCLNEIA